MSAETPDREIALERVLGDLVDALSDELKYEVANSVEVQKRILAAIPLLGPEYLGYGTDWWLAQAAAPSGPLGTPEVEG